MTMPCITGLPSSDTATHPASLSSAYSDNSFPSDRFVIAPIGYTRTNPSDFARSRMNSVMDLLSLTGKVLGMQQMEVNPPAAAAAVPV